MPKDYGLFIKFSSRLNHLESIRNGELYMNIGKFFIDLEDNKGLKGVGDKNEFKNICYNVGFEIYDSVSNKLLTKGTSSVFTDRSSLYLYNPIFCISLFKNEDFIKEVGKEGEIKVKLNPRTIEINKIIEDFGEYALIISANEFLNRLEYSLKRKSLFCVRSCVNYSDYSINNEIRADDYDNVSIRGFFHKDIGFSYQKEYRFVLPSLKCEEAYKFNMQSIHDISYVVKAEELFNLSFYE